MTTNSESLIKKCALCLQISNKHTNEILVNKEPVCINLHVLKVYNKVK